MAQLGSIISLILLFVVVNSGKSAIFENVTVLLTTEWNKLFYFGRTPMEKVYIASSDTLAEFVNLQPLEIVWIRNGNIPYLRKNSLSNLPNIVQISVVSSGVKKIDPGTFQNDPKLDIINLENNQIEEIPNGAFTGLHLKALYLNNNQISRLGSAAFSNMTMTVLKLDNNKISRWRSEVFMGTPIGTLSLANNLIEEIPANAFSYGFQFKRINVPLAAWHVVLSQNRIRKIHPQAFNMVNGFGYLSLADNYLTDLPKNLFRYVKNINTLDLTNNQISDVRGVFDDININQLVLINNTMNCFPDEVFDISRINFVFLDGNPVTCGCVSMWKDIQLRNNIWVVFNMKELEKNCIEK
ncbi:leucine-rich repeat-containing protein 15-like [Tribolium madens]|uniref:leucine-rich repeat-containing protein 15-like n=1 Tax=Tribolium madens TaxID=41895 RepID=UPI001CF73FB7|nr:leucine-rich repeat-containing protein 15-like [Tribolium madens]